MKNQILRDIKAKSEEGQVVLNKLQDSIEEEVIAWYPNCGDDVRDLFELSRSRLEKYHSKEFPNVFIHTSSSIEVLESLFELEETFYIKRDHFAAYNTKSVYELTFNKECLGEEIESPNVYLLQFNIESNKHGKFVQSMIYIETQTFNFFEEYYQKRQYNIKYLINPEEDDRNSVSSLYPILESIGIKYLVSGKMKETISIMEMRSCYNYELYSKGIHIGSTPIPYGSIVNWKGEKVSLYRIIKGGVFPNLNEIKDVINRRFRS